PVIDEHLNDAGREALAAAATECVGDGILRHGFSSTTAWTASGESRREIIEREPVIQRVVDQQRLGGTAPEIPVRLATGVRDDIVPHEQARQLAVDWCGRGADVTYVPVELPNLGDRLLTNHLAPLLVDQGPALDWL